MNRQGSLLCVLSVVVLLSGGLGQGVTGAVADPGEGLLAGQGSHAVHPVAYSPHRGHLWAAPVQQQVGWSDRRQGGQNIKLPVAADYNESWLLAWPAFYSPISKHTRTSLISQTQTLTCWPYDTVLFPKPSKYIWAVNTVGKSTCYGKYFHNIFNLFKSEIADKSGISFCLMSLAFPCTACRMQQNATADLIRVDGLNWIKLK